MKIGKCLAQDPHLSLVQIQSLKRRERKAAVGRQNLTMSQSTKSKAGKDSGLAFRLGFPRFVFVFDIVS